MWRVYDRLGVGTPRLTSSEGDGLPRLGPPVRASADLTRKLDAIAAARGTSVDAMLTGLLDSLDPVRD